MIPTTFQETILKCKNPNQCLGDLVFIHGFCVDHTYFKVPVGEKLAEHFNVYMIDLPGHGSNVKDVEAKDLNFENLANYVVKYIEFKNLKNIILVGHSMGGGIVSIVESKIRNRIKKLILVSPYCTGGLWLGFKAFYVFYPKNMKQKYRLLNLLYADYTQYLNNPEWVKMNEQQLAFQLANWKNMKTLFTRISNLGQALKVRKIQKNFKTPFILFVGKHDGSISSKHSLNAFNRWYPNGLNYVMFENSGHLCFEEEPDLFVQKVIEFVKE